MKYVLALIAAATIGNSASAQNSYKLQLVRAVHTSSIQPVEDNDASQMQAVLDRLQIESQNTVIYPLVHMTQLAVNKIEGLKKQAKLEKKEARIRTNNNGKKKPANPNRA